MMRPYVRHYVLLAYQRASDGGVPTPARFAALTDHCLKAARRAAERSFDLRHDVYAAQPLVAAAIRDALAQELWEEFPESKIAHPDNFLLELYYRKRKDTHYRWQPPDPVLKSVLTVHSHMETSTHANRQIFQG